MSQSSEPVQVYLLLGGTIIPIDEAYKKKHQLHRDGTMTSQRRGSCRTCTTWVRYTCCGKNHMYVTSQFGNGQTANSEPRFHNTFGGPWPAWSICIGFASTRVLRFHKLWTTMPYRYVWLTTILLYSFDIRLTQTEEYNSVWKFSTQLKLGTTILLNQSNNLARDQKLRLRQLERK